MASIERLKNFYDFDEAVLAHVNEAAGWQNRRSFEQLTSYYGIADGPHIVSTNQARAFEVLTVQPRVDYESSHARLYHLPMSMPIDEGMIMRGLRMFAADPSRQLIMVGNPSALGQRYGKLRHQDMKQVWRGDLTPVVDPFLSYLRRNGITSTEELGFSYGADKAAASAARAVVHGITVAKGVWMESAATRDRGSGVVGLARLGLDFASAGNALDEYVRACDSPPLDEARERADVGLLRYLAGLGRLSNLAIANSLAHAGFQQRAADALMAQPDMRASLVWGTASELTDQQDAQDIIATLSQNFGADRVAPLLLRDMHHAGGDEIDLHAAIVLQALK